MKNNFKIKTFLFVSIVVLFGFTSFVNAETPITFFIRNGESLLWNGPIPLPDEGNVEIPDKNGVSHTINARSVLAVLYSIYDSNDNFSLSNLQFFDSFSSFYIKCISDTSGTESCDNWQYSVGSTVPFLGVDASILSGGETVGIYFGTPHRLSFTDLNILTGESLNITAESYVYSDNTWSPLSGVSVGVTLPNPDDQWNPIIVSTSPVDAVGNVTITLFDPNTYSLGIVEDFYFPSYTVTVSLDTSRGSGISTSTISGGSSSVSINNEIKDIPPVFNISDAIIYLKSIQEEYKPSNGSDLYTDWATIAYSAANISDDMLDSILSRLENYATPSTLLTDNERRVMVLLSLEQNPYSFLDVNYIKIITDAFDGVQFGDSSLVNDDIFALIPLASAGYTESDDIVVLDISFILSKQNTNGSWEDSVDLTAAAIQALYPFVSVTGVNETILSANTYLQSMQKEDGGWGSVYSTSWVMQAMNMQNKSWTQNGKSPVNYLGLQQASDGAVLSSDETLQNRIWATSYVIPAALGKSWSMIFKKVDKIVENKNTDEIINKSKETTTEITKEANKTETIDKISRVDKKIIKNDSTKISNTQSSIDIPVASVISSDNPTDNKSFLKAVISTSSAILNFIQSGISQIFLLFSF